MSTLAARDRCTLRLDEGLRAVEDVLLAEARCDEPLLAAMSHAIVTAGGKRLRPRMTLLAYAALADSEDAPAPSPAWPSAVRDAAAGSELIHTATLVHDDIIDASPLRRGKPTIHLAYGLPHAIVAADYLFTRGFGLAAGLPKEVIQFTTNACTRLAEGQVLEQRLLHENLDLETYFVIIAKKTAEPLRACAESGAFLALARTEEGVALARTEGGVASAPSDVVRRFGEFGLDVGLAFQIADDLLDVVGDSAETGKPTGLDAKNGARTLPALLAAEAAARGVEPVAAAREFALRYVASAKEAIAPVVPRGPHRDALFALADAVVARKA